MAANDHDMKKEFKYIGFDADDTLWINELYYRETEKKFYTLLEDFIDAETAAQALYEVEMRNIDRYGYGAKGFMLSMIETALDVSREEIRQYLIREIIRLGHELIAKPLVLLEGVEEVIKKMQTNGNRIILATKGDLLDQERKLRNSGLEKYFHHIEIMSDKNEDNYRRLLTRLEVEAEDFLMIGNSVRSDILPVLKLGGHAIQVPCDTTWVHEDVEIGDDFEHFHKVNSMQEISDLLELDN